MLKQVYKNLGMNATFEQAEEAFKNKVMNKLVYLAVFHEKKNNCFDDLCFQMCNNLGLNYDDYKAKKIRGLFELNNDFTFSFNAIKYLNLKEFLVRLQVLINLSFDTPQINNEKYDGSPYLCLMKLTDEALKESLVDIGYKLYRPKNKPAIIQKKGVSLFDEKLILDILDWLQNYPEAYKNYSQALEFFLKRNYADCITNCHSSLESIAKRILKIKTAFDNDKTRNLLINKLELPEEWGKVLLHYSRIAHEFSTRHGGNQSIETSESQAEFYLYQTGTYLT